MTVPPAAEEEAVGRNSRRDGGSYTLSERADGESMQGLTFQELGVGMRLAASTSKARRLEMKAFLMLAVVTVLVSYSGVRAASARSDKPATKTAATAADSNADSAPVENFNGTIVLLNGRLYILRDDVNDTWYHLDDQQIPSKFLGKKVVVTGKLNPSVDMILVQRIEPSDG
jgi:hypothetical protein